MDIRRLRTASDRGLERVCKKTVIRRGWARCEQLAQMKLILGRTRPRRRKSRRMYGVDEAFLFLDGVGDQDWK